MFKTSIAAIMMVLCVSQTIKADDKHYGPVNVSARSTTGEEVRGPVTVLVVGINPVKASNVVGVNVTYTPGPDLTLPFIPPIPASGAQTTTAPSQGAARPPSSGAANATLSQARAKTAIARNSLSEPSDIGLTFAALIDNLNEYEQTRFALQGNIQASIDSATLATSQVAAFVSGSDATVKADPTGAVLLAQIPGVLNGPMSVALAAQWPNAEVSSLEGNLQVLKNSLATLPDNTGWTGWVGTASNKTAYDAAVSRVNDLIGLATQLESSSSKSASALADSQNKLRQWDAIFRSIASAGGRSFSASVPVTCSFGFGSNKNSEVDIVSTNYMAAAGTTPTKQQIVTVICSSPLSISAGFGFSTVQEHEVAFVQSQNASGSLVSVFGFKARSNFQPLPLLLLNTRLHEWNDDWAMEQSWT